MVVPKLHFAFLSVCLLVACEQANGQPSAPGAIYTTRDAGVSCARPAAGCDCESGAAPVDCYLPPRETENGRVCQAGTRFCRNGMWSECEGLRTYMLDDVVRNTSSNVGGASEYLVQAPTQCNSCNPTCYLSIDRPVAADLTMSNSSNVEYNSAAGGIRLKPITGRGTRGDDDHPSICGAGVVDGIEECDDGNTTSGDGCSSQCLLEEGYMCPTQNTRCVRTVCGNGIREGTEECDDGNLLIGDLCTPFCEIEPSCSGGSCTPVCGDGQVFPGEPCDDGNTRSGDGCSSTCALEPGFSCTVVTASPPNTIDIPIVYRDFRASHADFEHWCCGTDTGMVQANWSATTRKPVPIINASSNPSLTTAANFNQWYNNDAVNKTIADKLRVTKQADGTYVFDSTSWFPLDNRGWALSGEPHINGHNFHFTSEVRFWFKYARGQALSFRGDDDVWVFINGKLAVDIGGVHGATAGSITLNSTNEASYGLTAGGYYEAAVFQAERHTTESNYRLTLAGFFFGKTSCTSVCGDGIVTRDEICDDGVNNGAAGGCMPGCRAWAPGFVNSGDYTRTYDPTNVCNIPPDRPDWGTFTWVASTPSTSAIRFEFRTASTIAALATATATSITLQPYADSGSLDLTDLLAAAGRPINEIYVAVRAVLIPSTDYASSPVLTSFQVEYNCDPFE